MNSSAQSLHQTQRVTRLRYILVYLHDCGEILLVLQRFSSACRNISAIQLECRGTTNHLAVILCQLCPAVYLQL